MQILIKWLVKITKTKNRRVTGIFLGQGIFLRLKIHQIFHLSNKKINKKLQEIFLSTERITLKSFIRKSRLINIVPEHRFDVRLVDFEQIIYNDSIQLEAEWLNDINYIFPGSQANLEIFLRNFLANLSKKNTYLEVLRWNHFF